MLPIRAMAELINVPGENITFSNGTAIFKLSDELNLTVTANKADFTLGNDTITASTPPEIVNGTMFLPMRNLVNALGIDDDAITFDGNTKEISIALNLIKSNQE